MAYQNFFAAKLSTDIGSSDTSITLDTAPSATSGRMVLEARNPTQREVIKYTGVAGTQLTGVTRGQGGTSAKSHTKNSLIEMNLTSEDIQDLYDAYASFVATNNDWRNLPYTVGTITPFGNGSYSMTVNGINLTTILSEGMRLRTTRTVAAPNTAFSLDGVNDYYVKTSPNKMSFTDDFVTSAWVYLTAYPASFACISSKYNGTSGFQFGIDVNGQPVLKGFNAGSGNVSQVATIAQAIPLNKWVHVAAQLDMSAFTATTTTSYIMINGVDVPAIVSRSGTNPTSLLQAGNFEIGTLNGGTFPLQGYLDQVAVFSAKVTQATMLGYIHQPLIGTETNLASAYKNGSVTDLNTTSPNNLVATNGATTVNNAPYGNRGASTSIDFGVIMSKPVFAAGNTTFTIQVPEGCTIPTSGGVTTLDYSTVDVPYGFPRAKSRWELRALIIVSTDMGALAQNTWINPNNFSILAPVGDWDAGYELTPTAYKNATGSFDLKTTLSTSASSETDKELTTFNQGEQSTAGLMSSRVTMGREKGMKFAVATPLYANILTTRSGGVLGSGWSPDVSQVIKLKNAHI